MPKDLSEAHSQPLKKPAAEDRIGASFLPLFAGRMSPNAGIRSGETSFPLARLVMPHHHIDAMPSPRQTVPILWDNAGKLRGRLSVSKGEVAEPWHKLDIVSAGEI